LITSIESCNRDVDNFKNPAVRKWYRLLADHVLDLNMQLLRLLTSSLFLFLPRPFVTFKPCDGRQDGSDGNG